MNYLLDEIDPVISTPIIEDSARNLFWPIIIGIVILLIAAAVVIAIAVTSSKKKAARTVDAFVPEPEPDCAAPAECENADAAETPENAEE